MTPEEARLYVLDRTSAIIAGIVDRRDEHNLFRDEADALIKFWAGKVGRFDFSADDPQLLEMVSYWQDRVFEFKTDFPMTHKVMAQ